MAMAATTTTTELHAFVFGSGNYLRTGDDEDSVDLRISFQVDQTYYSTDKARKSKRQRIGEIISETPYHSVTHDHISTMIARMNIPFPLEKMQYLRTPRTTEEEEYEELQNVDDLITRLFDEGRYISSLGDEYYGSKYDESTGRRKNKKVVELAVLIMRTGFVPLHEIEAMDRAKEREDRAANLGGIFSGIRSWAPSLDFAAIGRQIGRSMRETAPEELDENYERELELSLLEQAMMECFPAIETLKIEGNGDNNIDDEDDKKGKELGGGLCHICKKDVFFGSGGKRLPCSHVYHARCIALWLKRDHLTCPSCSFKLTMYVI